MNDIQLKKIISNLINNYAKGELKKSFTDYQHTHTHVYYDKGGSIAFLKIRLKDFTTGKKWIRPFRYDSERKNYTIGETKFAAGKPLYRLPEVIKRDQETIWFCEGETCVEAMEKFGLLATTSGAAMSYSGSDFSPLANRKVNFFCDFDKAGFNYRENVTRKLQGLGCTLCWVDVDKLPLSEGGDFIDWMEAKGDVTQEDILNLPLVDAPNFTLEEEKEKQSKEANIIAPYIFEVSDKGIFYCKNGQLPVWLCVKLEITALTRDPNNENWGRVLEFRDADQQFHQWIMPDAMLKGNGEQLIGELLRLGLNIHPGQKQGKYLLEYISSVDIKERARCVLNIGWYKQAFVLPNKVYGQSEEKLLYQSDYTLHNYGQSGTLDEWKKQVASLCEDNTRLTFAVSQAFVGPLMGLLGLESGGFHLLGESSIGKSTILAVMASVYGNENYVHNLRATDNALEGLAAQHNHTLLILDELSQLNPRIAGEVFYMLANGQSKSRAFKTGQAKNRHYWRTSFITSGELSLKSLLELAGQTIRAGQEIRSINISADAGKSHGVFDVLHDFKDGASLSNHLKKQCQQYYGSAIDVFLTRLVKEDKIFIREKLNFLTTLFLKHLQGEEAHGQVKRVAERFALVTLAGTLASEWGITGWKVNSPAEAGIACFNSWFKDNREAAINSSEEEKILEQTRHFFESQSSRFDSFLSKRLTRNRAGFENDTRKDDTFGDYYIFVKTFKKEMCKGFEPSAVEQLLLKKGLLKPNAAGKVGEPIWVPSHGNAIRLYHFSSLVLGEKVRNS